MRESARNLFRLLCASGLIVVAVAALNFVVDPLADFQTGAPFCRDVFA